MQTPIETTKPRPYAIRGTTTIKLEYSPKCESKALRDCQLPIHATYLNHEFDVFYLNPLSLSPFWSALPLFSKTATTAPDLPHFMYTLLSSNIAKEEKRHIDIQTALNQRACNLTKMIHKEGEEQHRRRTPKKNAEEAFNNRVRPWSSATALRPLSHGFTHLTHGYRSYYPWQ